jgi:8-oxo-dGTP diphosphatase
MISAAFMILREPGGKVLLLRRAATEDHPFEWAFPGGKIKPGESAEDAAVREVYEESCWHPGSAGKWHCRTVRDGVDATTFVRDVTSAFTPPRMNKEHTAFMWVDPDDALAMNDEGDREATA